MKSFSLIMLICIVYFLNNRVYSQTIKVFDDNPTNTQAVCQYSFTGSVGLYFNNWEIPTNCVPVNSQGAPDYSKLFSVILPLKWKNIEASAFSSTLKVYYVDGSNFLYSVEKPVGPFILTLPVPTFTGSTTINIPCYSTVAITITLNSYRNTASNGIDQGETITSQFEWTLPEGWKTTTGIGGTIVGSSSISVVPIASSLPVSIQVRAKANAQYSAMATLPITRYLNDFTISSSLPSPVLCNSTIRFTAPAASGVSYSWLLPTGWTGTSTGNYIDVVAKGASGSISCTMTGCNGSKTSPSLPITVNVIDPATIISGPSLVCSSGATFTLSSLPSGCTVLWQTSGNLVEVSGQGTTTYRVKASGGNPPAMVMGSMAATTTEEEPGSSGWVKATISNACGSSSLPLMQKTVWAGFPGFRPVVTGPTNINCGSPQIYLEQNQQSIYWSVPSSMQIIGPAGPGYRCTIKGLELAAAGVIGTVSNACGSFSDILEVDIECSTLTLYPNPASSSIDVTIASDGSGTDTSLAKSSTPTDDDVTYTVRITNNYGIPFYTTQRTGNYFTIPVDNLKDGTYIVQVTDGDHVYNQKLIVKH